MKISTTIYRALDNANRIDAREDKGHREKCPPLSGYDCQKKRLPESDCNIDSDCQGHQEAGSLTHTFCLFNLSWQKIINLSSLRDRRF